MKEFSPEVVRFETASALKAVMQAQADHKYPAYIGLDVHKETLVVAVARAGRFSFTPVSLLRLLQVPRGRSVIRCGLRSVAPAGVYADEKCRSTDTLSAAVTCPASAPGV